MAVIEKRKGRDGEQMYRVKVRLRGYPSQSATFKKLTLARKWAQDTESAIRAGKYFTNIEARRHTLSETIDRYEKDILPHKPKTKKARQTHLKWWKSKLGPLLLADITPPKIAESRDELEREGWKRKEKAELKQRKGPTVNRYLASLSHVFTIAVNEWQWLESNPVRKVTKRDERKLRIRFLDEKEREALLAACKKSENTYLYTVVVLALSTGARKMEILNLRWSDVDFERKLIVLEETKNGERRKLPLVDHAHTVLKEFSKVRNINTQLVFPGADPSKPKDIRTSWETALKNAGIPNFRFHDLRHSCASYLAMNGASLAEIAEVLGHKTLQMVKRYAHISDSHVAGVVEKMNKKIFG